MSETVTASNGVEVPLISLAQTYTYDGDFVDTIAVVYNSITYTQTFTNDGTNITASSQWVAS